MPRPNTQPFNGRRGFFSKFSACFRGPIDSQRKVGGQDEPGPQADEDEEARLQPLQERTAISSDDTMEKLTSTPVHIPPNDAGSPRSCRSWRRSFTSLDGRPNSDHACAPRPSVDHFGIEVKGPASVDRESTLSLNSSGGSNFLGRRTKAASRKALQKNLHATIESITYNYVQSRRQATSGHLRVSEEQRWLPERRQVFGRRRSSLSSRTTSQDLPRVGSSASTRAWSPRMHKSLNLTASGSASMELKASRSCPTSGLELDVRLASLDSIPDSARRSSRNVQPARLSWSSGASERPHRAKPGAMVTTVYGERAALAKNRVKAMQRTGLYGPAFMLALEEEYDARIDAMEGMKMQLARLRARDMTRQRPTSLQL